MVTEGPWLVLVGWVTALSLGATVGVSGLSARVRMRTWPAQVSQCAGGAAVPTQQVPPQLCSHWELYFRFHTQALSNPPDGTKVVKQVNIYAFILHFTQQQNRGDQVVIAV